MQTTKSTSRNGALPGIAAEAEGLQVAEVIGAALVPGHDVDHLKSSLERDLPSNSQCRSICSGPWCIGEPGTGSRRWRHGRGHGGILPGVTGGGTGWGRRPTAMSLSGPSARAEVLVCRYLARRSHMATNLALDQDLLDHAFRVSGEPTKKAAVTRALQEFIARREQRQVAELFGKLEWAPDYDYKAERERQR